jgi:hypothetical protein
MEGRAYCMKAFLNGHSARATARSDHPCGRDAAAAGPWHSLKNQLREQILRGFHGGRPHVIRAPSLWPDPQCRRTAQPARRRPPNGPGRVPPSDLGWIDRQCRLAQWGASGQFTQTK